MARNMWVFQECDSNSNIWKFGSETCGFFNIESRNLAGWGFSNGIARQLDFLIILYILIHNIFLDTTQFTRILLCPSTSIILHQYSLSVIKEHESKLVQSIHHFFYEFIRYRKSLESRKICQNQNMLQHVQNIRVRPSKFANS